MKTMLLAAAAAFTFAVPAAAQPAPSHQDHGSTQNGHAPGHGQHQGHGSSTGHQGHAGHAQHGQGEDHSKHADCCGDANGNGKMDCCEGAAAAQRPCCAGHAEHAEPGKQPAPAQPNNR